MDTTAPPPSRFRTSARPPCARVIRSTIASPRPLPPSTPGLVGTAEAVERLLGEVGREAGALVRHAQLDPVTLDACGEQHGARAVHERVLDEVAEGLLDPNAVRVEHRAVRRPPRRPSCRARAPAARSAWRPCSSAPSADTRSRRIGSSPLSERAISRRSSASCDSRSVSSATDRSACSSSACDRGWRSAISTSVLRSASGVRSS